MSDSTFCQQVTSLSQINDTTTHLEFTGDFDQSLIGFDFPSSITSITFSCNYNRPIDDVQWPPHLTTLSFAKAPFDQPLDNLPSTLERLAIGDSFRHWQTLRDAWPSTLTHLSLGNSFNDRLQTLRLPDSLTHLNVGSKFDQPIDHVQWPPQLIALRLGCSFDQSLRGASLPHSLTVLQVDDDYYDRHACYLQTLPLQVALSPEDEDYLWPRDLFSVLALHEMWANEESW